MKSSRRPLTFGIFLLTTCFSQAVVETTDTISVYDENVNQPNSINLFYTNIDTGLSDPDSGLPAGPNSFQSFTAFTDKVTAGYGSGNSGIIDDWVPQLNNRTTGNAISHQITGEAWGTSLGSNGYSDYTNPTDTLNTPTTGIFVSFDDDATNPLYNRAWAVVKSSDINSGALSDRFGNPSIGGYVLELGTGSGAAGLATTNFIPKPASMAALYLIRAAR